MIVVVSTLAFLINLFLAVAFWRRGQNIASAVSISTAALSAAFIGLWIFTELWIKAQEQNSNQKRETEWVCTIVDDQKICTRNQENEAREDKTSEWDCVTEGNRKICIKHGAEK